MKTPWLKVCLLALSAALTVDCSMSVTNRAYCASDDECAEGSSCDVLVNQCQANVSETLDAGETCETAEQQCVDSAPEGWSGPVARSDSRAGDAIPGCEGDFGINAGLYGSELVVGGSCECECGSPTNLFCGQALLTEWTSSEGTCEQGICDIIGGDCREDVQALPLGSCRALRGALQDEPFLQASFGQILSGSCDIAETSRNLTSQFTSISRLCEPQPGLGNCGTDKECAPTAGDGFESGLCIVQTGEHECPAGSDYTERTLLFRDVRDDRVCGVGSCECLAPTGSCNGEIELHDGGGGGDLCNAALATLGRSSSPLADDNLCQSLPGLASTARYVVDLDDHACRPQGQADVTGEVVGIGATTLCCMP